MSKNQHIMKKVAVFGSSRTPEDSNLFKAVERMSQKLAESGYTVVTGGGPGIMLGANKGAHSVSPELSEAQAIYLPFEAEVNEYVSSYEKHDEFFSRLKTFSECDAFVVCPGGIGTLLEMALIFQLLQVNHMDHKPVICVGSMWRSLKTWMEEEMVDSGMLYDAEMELIHYVDRFSEASLLLEGLLAAS